jgi:UDP-N-acetylglucosamine/UDP-N-acetyl-alpha-D-glucosaminouronate 4-epimerase
VRALVTGGGGFIGSHLAVRLLEEGHEVRVLDNFATGRRENLILDSDEIDLVEGDVQSYERVHTAVRGCELVFHQAALPSVPRSVQDPLTTNAVNVIGTLNVLLAGRDSGVRRVICASSSSVYGANADLPKREDMPVAPLSPYAVGKLAGEGYCRSFHAVYGVETVVLRYFNIFGSRQDPLSQYSAVIPKFIADFLEGRQPVIFGDGEQSRDFTYVANVVDANLLAAFSKAAAGSVYNVACGISTTVNQLVEELRDITGRQLDPLYEPPRPGEVRHSAADIGLAQHELGYAPSVDFREGLERTTSWYETRFGAGKGVLAG